MNDIDKRLEEIEKRWCPNYSDIQWLVDTLKAEREEKERLEKELIAIKASKSELLERFDKLENKYEALGGDRE